MGVPAAPAGFFMHPGTGVYKAENAVDSVSDQGKVKARVMRKAGYEKVSGNTYKQASWLSKFNYFSSVSRNAHSTARAYYESGHLLTAAFLRETAGELKPDDQKKTPATFKDAENLVWERFKGTTNIQKKCRRQDYVTHRTHMLESGTKTTETQTKEGTSQTGDTKNSETAPLLEKTKGNRFSRISTKLARTFMSACECTSAPTGFTYRALRNFAFHGVSDKGLINKGATAASTIFIGMAASAIVSTIRSSAGTSGYGFNPLQILTGVLVAFAAVSGIAGGLSWISGLASQAAMKDIEPSDEQKQFIQFEMNSTVNRVNEMLLQHKDNPTMIKMIDRAMSTEFPSAKLERGTVTINGQTIEVSKLLATWFNSIKDIPGEKDLKGYIKDPDKGVKLSGDAQKEALTRAKTAIGNYLLKDTGSTGPTDQTLRPAQKQLIHNKEKEFAALAGLVEHFETEDKAAKPAQHEDHLDTKTHSLPNDRIDARQFTEEFAQRRNRALLMALATPALVLDWMFNHKAYKQGDYKISGTIKRYADKNYTKNRDASLGSAGKAHLHKYHAEYIAGHLHQYGPITRALIKASDFIHNVNYNYILAVNAQTSRLYNKAAQAFQESVLGQHSSKIACSAFGRFLGGMTVTIVSFLGISALAGLTGGGSAANGFQNSSAMGSAKLSWLITGTLMSVVGLPAFALGLLAKVAARAEGWKGAIDAPETQSMQRKSERDPHYLVRV
jgi:hypothetical protein